MLLVHSRRPARDRRPTVSSSCSPSRTARLWDRDLIDEGQALVRRCLRRNQPGPYQIQAAINAVHSDAADRRGDRLAPDPRPLRPADGAHPDRGGRAQPRRRGGGGRRSGSRAGLIDALPLDRYYLYHAIRADLLRRLGRTDEAAAAYRAAIARTDNAAETALLERRVDALLI